MALFWKVHRNHGREGQHAVRDMAHILQRDAGTVAELAEKVKDAMQLSINRPDVYARILSFERTSEPFKMDRILWAADINDRELARQAESSMRLARQYPGNLKDIQAIAGRASRDEDLGAASMVMAEHILRPGLFRKELRT